MTHSVLLGTERVTGKLNIIVSCLLVSISGILKQNYFLKCVCKLSLYNHIGFSVTMKFYN